jgi:putative two-component system response regulator
MPAHILVVDDDPIIVGLLTRMLARDGYEVLTARDGVEALDLVATHQPDLVLLDVTMPRMDGFAVCRRLKENEQTALIPVTMLTGLDDQDHRRRGIEAGADDFLTKPIDQTILKARIRTQRTSSSCSPRLWRRRIPTPRATCSASAPTPSSSHWRVA